MSFLEIEDGTMYKTGEELNAFFRKLQSYGLDYPKDMIVTPELFNLLVDNPCEGYTLNYWHARGHTNIRVEVTDV